MTPVDRLTVDFEIKDNGMVARCDRRTVSADGKVLTIESWTYDDGQRAEHSTEVWTKIP